MPNRTTRTVACVVCGAEVIGNAKRKYCGHKCRIKAWREARPPDTSKSDMRDLLVRIKDSLDEDGSYWKDEIDKVLG